MKIEIGDKVRFLNDVGGGVVTRIHNKMVYVEDADGFEIPALMSECVLIEKKEKPQAEVKSDVSGARRVEQVEYIVEEEIGDDSTPHILLALLQGDKPGSESGNVRLFLVNDSNYYTFYTIASNATGPGKHELIFHGTIEPNTKVLLDKIPIRSLDEKTLHFQMVLFKKSKSFQPVPVLNTTLKIKGLKLIRESSFIVNDYFNEKAVLYPVLKNEIEQKLEQLAASQFTDEWGTKDVKPIVKPKQTSSNPDIIEIDLHIHELLDDVRGLSNGEMLQVQLKKFHSVMEENQSKKGQKIVFIHGVGNGVLKQELRKLMDTKYKKHYYQDASFKEYGYGATMVIV
jgi:hypothetical protein